MPSDGNSAIDVERGKRSLRCRIGLHKWSDNRGGIKVCKRDHCQKARTHGFTGTIRRRQWERRLYNEYQRYTEEE